LASQVIDNIFHMFFCLDGNSIKQILDLTEDSSEDQVYSKLCSDLWKQKHLPFEPSFQALFEIYGFSAIRFVDLLSGGEPNLHHKMLAYALHKGHSIITTNFDQQIERAFSSSFPGENLKILITDLDYQEALDKQHFNGVLAKIHGDMKKYNSLALTTEQIAVSNDKTVWVGRDISPEKGKRQLGQVYPLSSLSVPKALFLQTIISTKSTVIMGYSGSDVFDIMPILVTPEFNSHGLWVNHGINTNADPWLTKGSDRFLLQPLTKKDESFDITSKVSKYFLELFGGNYYSDNTGEQSPPLTSEDFVVWAKRLGIREGDGLSLIATLYIQMGKWYEAHLFYKEAMKKYAENLEFSENRLLWAKTSMAYALRNLGRKEAAVSIAMEIKNYIEKNGKENLYASIYSTVLLNLASELPGTDCDADSSLEKALSIDETTKSKRTACFAKRITAKRHFERGEYQQALEFWLQAMKIAIDETGDLNEAYSSSLGAGECYVKMGDFYSALQLTNNAINYAKQMQDETAIERANLNYASIFSYFQGDSPTSVYHNMFIESAMDAIGPKRAEEIKVAMQYTQNGSYDHAITIINRLLNSYKNAEILAFLFFLRSNIYHRKGEWLMDIESLNKSNSVKTNNPLVECNLGIAYIMTSNLAIAEKHLSKAIDLVGGNYPLAICYIGIVYAKQNKLQEAKVQLSRAEKLHSPEYFLGELRQAIARI
jgi:tetratricopeptide (TPR) repeat protein